MDSTKKKSPGDNDLWSFEASRKMMLVELLASNWTTRKELDSMDHLTRSVILKQRSRARRKLSFGEDFKSQADIDNFANRLQESCRIDQCKMMRKWNFDFKNEKALDGPYEWQRKDDDSWVGMKPDPESVTEDKFVPIEKENQMTPKVTTVVAPPVVRKRQSDISLFNEKGAKRKINFE